MKTEQKKYIEAIGRRKTAVARVRLSTSVKPSIVVNGKDISEFFKEKRVANLVNDIFEKGKAPQKYMVSALVYGGGVVAQAEALRHGIARAIAKENPDLRKDLKKAGFIKRDPRSKERRKFGLKKARKAPQWSKR
jgi:small subunit ribosomal protein S9